MSYRKLTNFMAHANDKRSGLSMNILCRGRKNIIPFSRVKERIQHSVCSKDEYSIARKLSKSIL